MKYNLVSFAGIFVLLALAWVLSGNRRKLNLRCVAGGLVLQLVLGAIVFFAPGVTEGFLWLNDKVVHFLTAALEGARFIFGPLALPPGESTAQGESSIGFVLALQAFPVIIFFAALMGLLYYWRIMIYVIRGFAWLFTRFMRISGAESLCTASNIFVGIESATAVRPYLARMTRSELSTILTAGMATVASSTLGVYVLFLKDAFPTIAGHLISASIMSAPAAVVMSKILVPEEQEPLTLGCRVTFDYERESSAMEAVINGAMAGVKLVVGICALLIAFLGLLKVADLGIAGLGDLVGYISGTELEWSLSKILGYIMSPFALIIGVPPTDATAAGGMLGERLIATEIPAYRHLAQLLQDGSLTYPRSGIVIAYALCGFAHIASLAIFVGGLSALVPQRRGDLTSVAWRALLGANLACLMTGAIAGVFYHQTKGIL